MRPIVKGEVIVAWLPSIICELRIARGYSSGKDGPPHAFLARIAPILRVTISFLLLFMGLACRQEPLLQ
jgi:hypothetical protein